MQEPAALVVQALPAPVPALPLAPALDHPVRVASAALHVPAALHPPARPRARRVLLPEAAADARSIQRPKKAR
jgi:hypothetical protein